MKNFCVSLAFVMVLVLPSTVMAQAGGAIVVREKADWDIAWLEWDGDQTLIISSTYPDFFCGDAESVPDRIQVVTGPTAAQHYLETGRFFTRVYYGTLEDLLGTTGMPKNPFDFICGNLPTAEGILSFMMYDSQMDPSAPGANVWGHVMNGALTDLTETCKGHMVQVDIIHLWRLAPGADYPACDPSCVDIRVWKGPTVRCTQ